MISKVFMQFKTLFPILIKLYTPIVILIFLVLFISKKTGVPLKNFTVDPTAIARMNPFMGVVSNIGILFWCAAASICFFSFALFRETKSQKKISSFLLFSGFVTSILLFDDLFLFHEKNYSSREILFPNSFISQEIIYLSYAMIFLFYLIKFGKLIIKTDFLFLLLAFLFFGTSVSIDLFGISLLDYPLIEDGCKLLGIVSWFGYFFVVCFKAIKEHKHSSKF